MDVNATTPIPPTPPTGSPNGILITIHIKWSPSMHPSPIEGTRQHAWNKGKLVGQKPPLKLTEIWAIRTRFACQVACGIWRY